MPAVIVFLVGLVLVAFLIAFGANKLLEATGINIDVPGGYILPTILVIVLLYLPFAVSANVQFRRARDRDPDSLFAQDTRTLNRMARRNEAAARALHQLADQVDSDPEPKNDLSWTVTAIKDRLDRDRQEVLRSDDRSIEAVRRFLARVRDLSSEDPLKQLVAQLPGDYYGRLSRASAAGIAELDQLSQRAAEGTLVHFNGQAPVASRSYRVQRVATLFRTEMGIRTEADAIGKSRTWQADDLVLSGQLEPLTVWVDATQDPATLATRMLDVSMVWGSWLLSPERRSLT